MLLDYLLHQLAPYKEKIHLLLDKRYPIDNLPDYKFDVSTPSMYSRHIFYLKFGNNFEKVFCFGNVPPSVRLKGKVYTYFHNYLLLSRPKRYPRVNSFKKHLKMLLIGLLKNNSDLFIVQSAHTQTALIKRLGIPRLKCHYHTFL